ncbi:uncharacterized protein N7506_000022 [Penicillium brevicompactum]|uniref:uncharacterized protein n=1 Tax=Penicillium brevicompactum TaxID=5074 RepID=UPI0025411D07|nr:uncharacterized protein N7506_000022 [Penicillium brevicompactum]KAJ5346769.1 hypothetical protein N7506_000022 [Penicillium brevicompactum]
MLDRIPAEVVLLIADHIRQKRDLLSLSQVSKHLLHSITPIIYKSITLSSSEWDISNLKTGLILKYSARHVRFVKSLEVAAPFHRRLRTRCSEESDLEDEASEGSDDGVVELNRAVSTDSFSSEDLDIDSSETVTASIGIELEGAVMDWDARTESTTSATVPTHDGLMMNLESHLIPLLECIPEGQLQMFRYHYLLILG